DDDAGGDHPGEVLARLGVDRGRIGVDAGVEVDFRLRDVEEAPRLALGALARLGAREHVIGRRQDLGGAPGCRTQRTKRGNERQRASPWLVTGAGLVGGAVWFNIDRVAGGAVAGAVDFVRPCGLADPVVARPIAILIGGPTAGG